MMTADEGDPGAGRAGLAGPFGVLADPRSEASRVAAARRVVSARPETLGLNRVTALAARVLGAQSSQVSILAAEQTVMAGAGAAEPGVGARSANDDSLCTIPVRAGEPVAIADATSDARSRSLPPVTSGAVSSYLGAPLRVDGQLVGVLCVFDAKKRTWTEDDVAVLTQLAQSVVVEIEFSLLSSAYEQDRARWQVAVDAAGVGAFDWDLTTGALRWDDRLLELFGLRRATFGGTIEAFNAAVHPDDRDRVGAALSEAIEQCGTYSAEYRVVRPDGEVRWVGARGEALPGPEGQAVRVVGAAYDTTAERDTEARVARTLEVMPTAYFHLDRQWRFTYANREAQRLLGDIGADPVGHVVWDLFPAAVGTEFETSYREAVRTGEPVSFEAYYPLPLDGWFEVRCWPGPDGLSVYFVEVSARHEAQLVIANAARRAAVLAEVTRSLTDTLDEDEAVHRLTRLVVPTLADWCVVTLADGEVGVDDPAWRRHLRGGGWWHAEATRRSEVEQLAAEHVRSLTADSPVIRVLASGETVHLVDGAEELMTSALTTGAAADLARGLAPRSCIVVPLRGRGRLAGALSIFRGPGREAFTAADVDLVEAVAARAGLALDHARLYADQRELAETLQRSLLTAPPEPDHLHVAVRYQPATQAAKVGGDWYDSFMQSDGATTVVIGDVAGHDIAAAATMGQARGLLRGIAVTTGAGPAEVLQRLDTALEVLQVEALASVVVARLEQTPQEREAGLTRLRWSNAGHLPPIVIVPAITRATSGDAVDTVASGDGDSAAAADLLTGEVDRVTAHVLWGDHAHTLVGLGGEHDRCDQVVTLPRGATLLFYTDGLVERRGEVLDHGVEELRRLLVELVEHDHTLDELCDLVLHRMLPARTEDDVALVAVRLHPEDRPRPAEAGPGHVPAPLRP